MADGYLLWGHTDRIHQSLLSQKAACIVHLASHNLQPEDTLCGKYLLTQNVKYAKATDCLQYVLFDLNKAVFKDTFILTASNLTTSQLLLIYLSFFEELCGLSWLVK